ncbi:MAG: hypothetical protein ABI556_09785 [Gemmatimonadales bacterium]
MIFKKGQEMSDSHNDRQTKDSRDPESKSASSQADGTKRDSDLDPASSGTTPLVGETPDSGDRQGSGGVEGTGNNG